MKVVIHPSFKQLTDFIYSLHEKFDLEGELLHKGRNTVKQYEVDGIQLVVKRFKHPNLIQQIVYTFFKRSKTARAYDFAALLRQNGIDTPHEVAYIETTSHGLFSTGYFISLQCSYAPVSKQIYIVNGQAVTPTHTSEFDHHLADNLAAFFVELHSKGILHGDLNLSNILCYQKEDHNYHFCVIDTNRSQFKKPTQDECLENLKRITHKRNVLVYVISRYAELRGWSPEKCTKAIIQKLDHFENKNRLKRKIQCWLGIKK